VTPLLFILGNLWIVLFSIERRPMSTLFGLATIAVGFLLYAWFARRKNRTAPNSGPSASQNPKNEAPPEMDALSILAEN
jgi:hypothetical protein